MVSSKVSSRSREKVLGGLRIGRIFFTEIGGNLGYLVNCMRRGWYKKWQENGWLTRRKEPVANRDLWERLLQATQRHQEVLWRKVRGHSKSGGSHKSGNDRADELAVVAKKEAMRPSTPSSP